MFPGAENEHGDRSLAQSSNLRAVRASETAPEKLKNRKDRKKSKRNGRSNKKMDKRIKILWRLIRLGISIWQIVDMVSDGFQTKKYFYLSRVRRKIIYFTIVLFYFVK